MDLDMFLSYGKSNSRSILFANLWKMLDTWTMTNGKPLKWIFGDDFLSVYGG